jgi:hypothetical protein
VGGQTPRWPYSIRGGTGLARKPTENQTPKAATVARLPNPRANWASMIVEKSHDQSFPLARLSEEHSGQPEFWLKVSGGRPPNRRDSDNDLTCECFRMLLFTKYSDKTLTAMPASVAPLLATSRSTKPVRPIPRRGRLNYAC